MTKPGTGKRTRKLKKPKNTTKKRQKTKKHKTPKNNNKPFDPVFTKPVG
jgi:hypothetical protein